MIARMRVRRSRLARISRRLGILSVPILVIAALAHRAGTMETIAALISVGVGFVFAAIAVIFAIFALVMIWHDGRLGARDAMVGFFTGMIALVPLAPVVYGIVQFPRLNDISTDVADPPRFELDSRAGKWGANQLANRPEEDWAKQKTAYPDIVPRRFPLTPAQMYEAASRTVEQLGWDVVLSEAPGETSPRGTMQAVARSLIFAFPDDVMIRILPDDYGARLDIRSASRYGRHDIGANTARIREFFEALDDAVLEVAAELPADEGDGAEKDG